jgi:hypothetical protein
MPPVRTYPRIDGPKRQPDGTYLVLVYRSADDLERVPAKDLATAQQVIATLQKAKSLFTPNQEKVLARATGRKPKLTPEIHKAIVQRIADGCPNVVAAQASGISEKTFYNWLNRGREATLEADIYFQFLQDVEVAAADDEYSLVRTMRRSAEHDWRAAEALLKRSPRYKSRWSDKGIDTGEGVQVIFHRPEMDDSVKSDELVSISDVKDTEGEGEGNGAGGR